jgi:hypothetical protein
MWVMTGIIHFNNARRVDTDDENELALIKPGVRSV